MSMICKSYLPSWLHPITRERRKKKTWIAIVAIGAVTFVREVSTSTRTTVCKFPRPCNIVLPFNVREHQRNDALWPLHAARVPLSIKILILSRGVVAFHTIRIMARRCGLVLRNESLTHEIAPSRRTTVQFRVTRTCVAEYLRGKGALCETFLRKVMLIWANLSETGWRITVEAWKLNKTETIRLRWSGVVFFFFFFYYDTFDLKFLLDCENYRRRFLGDKSTINRLHKFDRNEII